MAQGGLIESEAMLLEAAIAQATKSFDEGGLPIGFRAGPGAARCWLAGTTSASSWVIRSRMGRWIASAGRGGCGATAG